MLTIKYYSYRDSTRKPLLTSLDLLLSTHHTLLRLSSTQVLLMLLSTALRSSIHQSRRLPLLLSHALPNTIMSLLKLLLMLVPLVFWSFASKSQSLLLRESQPPLLVRSPSTLKNLLKPSLTKVPFHILLL